MARKRQSELPGMTVSFLDVMSCGFGAAVLLMVMLAMNLGAPTSANVLQLKEELREARRNQGSFLLVTIAWDAKPVDIDLYVTSPDGQTCSFQAPEVQLRNGAEMTLFFDVRTEASGRPEGILASRAMPGVWQVNAQYYSGLEEVYVRGTVRGSNNQIDLPVARFGPNRYREMVPLATLDVAPSGDIRVAPLGGER